MDLESQAEAVVEKSRKQAVVTKLREKMPEFRYRAEHVEKRQGETDWTCRLHAVGPDSQIVGGLHITIKSPSPIEFDRLYAWELIAFCPMWVVYYGHGLYVRFRENSRPVSKFPRR